VFEKNNNDMIYNWRNELKANQNGAFLVAENIASKLKTAGHSKSNVIELLAAQEFDLELTNRVASKLFDNVTSAPKPTVHVAVVPTKYADCAPIIEKSLERLSAREFTKRLCSGPYAIVKIDDKQFDSWQRLAELAKNNSSARTSLHAELKPWVEEALLNSVLVAGKNKGQVTASDNNKVYKVAMKNTEAIVDLANGTSTSDKYVKGNYSTFGLADEYMVAAADKVSPYERLKRALDF